MVETRWSNRLRKRRPSAPTTTNADAILKKSKKMKVTKKVKMCKRPLIKYDQIKYPTMLIPMVSFSGFNLHTERWTCHTPKRPPRPSPRPFPTDSRQEQPQRRRASTPCAPSTTVRLNELTRRHRQSLTTRTPSRCLSDLRSFDRE